jgi:uncharacterized integral membrane protein
MQNAKLVGILILTLVLAVVVIQNRAPVETHILFATVEMPLVMLLSLTAAAGFALGLLVALVRPSKR